MSQSSFGVKKLVEYSCCCLLFIVLVQCARLPHVGKQIAGDMTTLRWTQVAPGCASSLLGSCAAVSAGSVLYRMPARGEITESLVAARSFLFCLLPPRIFQKRSLDVETHTRQLSLVRPVAASESKLIGPVSKV